MFIRTETFPKGIGMNNLQPPSLSKTQNRILVLSEDADLGHAMRDDLGKLGLHVNVDSVYQLGNGLTKSLPHDGIILDMDIKESSRQHVFRDLYAANSYIPIVVVGTETNYYDLFLAFMSGAKEFLVKPVDPVSLQRICLRIFL